LLELYPSFNRAKEITFNNLNVRLFKDAKDFMKEHDYYKMRTFVRKTNSWEYVGGSSIEWDNAMKNIDNMNDNELQFLFDKYFC
jgi:hypothetical protein